jgi:hypothetical protein
MAVRSVELLVIKSQTRVSSTTVGGEFSQVHRRTVRDIWQEYERGLNGQEPRREIERPGAEWRRDPVDPKTGKRGSALEYVWSALHAFPFIGLSK